MISLDIAEPFSSRVTPAVLEKAAQATLDHQLAAPEAGITIVITDDSKLQQLNQQFLGEDAPTDVLSFPADYTDPDTRAPYLGDVLISIPRAEAQAISAGHPLEDELQILVVHGVLHLLGHDHLAADEKTRMWAAQSDILENLGIPTSSFPD